MDCADYIIKKRLKLDSFCESKQYFVFVGPEFKEKDKGEKKEAPAEKEEKKATSVNQLKTLEKTIKNQTIPGQGPK